jgi:hypothetical protein
MFILFGQTFNHMNLDYFSILYRLIQMWIKMKTYSTVCVAVTEIHLPIVPQNTVDR